MARSKIGETKAVKMRLGKSPNLTDSLKLAYTPKGKLAEVGF